MDIFGLDLLKRPSGGKGKLSGGGNGFAAALSSGPEPDGRQARKAAPVRKAPAAAPSALARPAADAEAMPAQGESVTEHARRRFAAAASPVAMATSGAPADRGRGPLAAASPPPFRNAVAREPGAAGGGSIAPAFEALATGHARSDAGGDPKTVSHPEQAPRNEDAPARALASSQEAPALMSRTDVAWKEAPARWAESNDEVPGRPAGAMPGIPVRKDVPPADTAPARLEPRAGVPDPEAASAARDSQTPAAGPPVPARGDEKPENAAFPARATADAAPPPEAGGRRVEVAWPVPPRTAPAGDEAVPAAPAALRPAPARTVEATRMEDMRPPAPRPAPSAASIPPAEPAVAQAAPADSENEPSVEARPAPAPVEVAADSLRTPSPLENTAGPVLPSAEAEIADAPADETDAVPARLGAAADPMQERPAPARFIPDTVQTGKPIHPQGIADTPDAPTVPSEAGDVARFDGAVLAQAETVTYPVRISDTEPAVSPTAQPTRQDRAPAWAAIETPAKATQRSHDRTMPQAFVPLGHPVEADAPAPVRSGAEPVMPPRPSPTPVDGMPLSPPAARVWSAFGAPVAVATPEAPPRAAVSTVEADAPDAPAPRLPAGTVPDAPRTLAATKRDIEPAEPVLSSALGHDVAAPTGDIRVDGVGDSEADGLQPGSVPSGPAPADRFVPLGADSSTRAAPAPAHVTAPMRAAQADIFVAAAPASGAEPTIPDTKPANQPAQPASVDAENRANTVRQAEMDRPVTVVERPAPAALERPSATQAVMLSQTAAGLVSALGEDESWAARMRPAAQAEPSGQTVTQQPNDLRIRLNPAELGAVSARLRLTGGLIAVTIEVETAQAMERLSVERESIERALRGLGLDVERVTIQQAAMPDRDMANGGSGGMRDGQQAGEGQNGARDGRMAEQGRERGQGQQRENGHGGTADSEQPGDSRGVYI